MTASALMAAQLLQIAADMGLTDQEMEAVAWQAGCDPDPIRDAGPHILTAHGWTPLARTPREG